MKRFIDCAEGYAVYRQNSKTRILHALGIPLLIFSLMLLFGFVKVIIPGVLATSLATVSTLVLILYYFRLHWRLTLVATPLLAILLFLAHLFSHQGPTRVALWVFALSFVLALILLVVGYFLEDKRLSTHKSCCLVPISPLLLTAELCFMMHLMPGVKAALCGKKGKD